MARRLKNWPFALHQRIEDFKDTEFEWGVFDCVTFAMACVEAMTGRPLPIPELTYTTEEEARAFNQTHRLADGLIEHANGELVQPGFIQQGDVVITLEDDLEKVAVCIGDRVAMPWPGKHGLSFVPLKRYPLDGVSILRVF